MIEMNIALKHAVKLMHDALDILDAEGEGEAALHLQWAIDLADHTAPLQPGDEIELGPLHDVP